MRIAIIGAGAIGKAIAGLIRGTKNVTIDFWDNDTSKVPQQKPLSQVIQHAAVVLICVPSWAVRAVGEAVALYLPPITAVVSVAKGIEPDTHKTMDEVLREVLPPKQPFALLCGPMLADEIVKGMPAAAVVGTTTRRVFTRLTKVFAGTMLRLEYSRDVHGVALVSVLKNIYAIGVGIGEGLSLGDNFRGWFMNRAAGEMTALLKLLGGRPTTVYSSAGLGDFIATGVSPFSRNHIVGRELGEKGSTASMSEGLASLPSLMHLVRDSDTELPLLHAIYAVALEKHHARPVFQALFAA